MFVLCLAYLTISTQTDGFNWFSSVFKGTQSPCAVQKLLSLSESKVKPVKSSSSMPMSHANNCNGLKISNPSGTPASAHANGTVSPLTLSPKPKRSISSSQPLNKYIYTIPLSSESSSVSTIKLNGKYGIFDSTYSTYHSANQSTANPNPNAQVNSSEYDSGRASMISNMDQDQYSPTVTSNFYPSANMFSSFNETFFFSSDLSNDQINYKTLCKLTLSQPANKPDQNLEPQNKLKSPESKSMMFKKSKSQNEIFYNTETYNRKWVLNQSMIAQVRFEFYKSLNFKMMKMIKCRLCDVQIDYGSYPSEVA